MQLMSAFSCPFPIVFCLFYHPLQRCLALSSSIYKDNMFLSLQLFQLFMQTAQVIAVNRRLMDNTKAERFFCPGYKCEKFLHQLCLVLGTGFFPDKGILVSVQKEKLPGYGAYPDQHVHHPSQYYFTTGRQMQRTEPGNGNLVRPMLSFQQIHKIQIPAAGLLNLLGTKDAVHGSVYHNCQ